MNNIIQQRMLNAVYACLLPLARLLIRSGITYQQFDTVAKRAFVREATNDTDGRGRLANISRVAVKTGLSRKDVKRIRDSFVAETELASRSSENQSGPLARVLHTWHVDRRFSGVDGKPRDLDLQDEQRGFVGLVRAVAGDVPPGAVCAELKRAGAIESLENGKLRAVKRYYVPGNVDEKAITVVSGMLFPLACGIDHNADPNRTADGFIQRFAYSDALDSTSIAEFRKWSRQRATGFIEEMDDWLAEHEDEDSGGSPDGLRQGQTAGIGVFYYEGPLADDVVAETLAARPRRPEPKRRRAPN